MNGPASRPDSLDDKVRAVEALVRLFQFERFVYLGVTGASLIMLLIAVAKLLMDGQRDLVVLTSLFGSSGLLTFALGRVLRMYDQAMSLITGARQGDQP